jgi:hypothetical protein
MIRDFEPNDIFEIEDIHNSMNNFPMTNFNSPCKILKKTIEFENEVVGAAYVQLTVRVGMILDKNLLTLVKAKLIKELFLNLLQAIEQTDLEDVHVFVAPEDELFRNFLKNNFNFEDGKDVEVFRRMKNV